MAIPLIPLIMAVASLGLGVAQGVSSVKQTQDQLDANTAQANDAITARKKQAIKLLNQQKTSFLKSGVYLEGTPEAVLDETATTSAEDIQALLNDSDNKANLLKRQGTTAFASSMLSALTGAATSFIGLGGLGNAANAAGSAATTDTLVKSVSGSRIGTNVQNWYSGLRGWSKGGFGGSTSGTKIV